MLVVLLLAAWRGREALLLLFGGVLLAVLLSTLTEALRRRVPLGRKAAYGVVLLGLVLGIAAVVLLAAPSVSRQFDALTESLPQAAGRLAERMEGHRWARELMGGLPKPQEMLASGSEMLTRTTTVLSSTLGAVAAFLIVLVIGLYLAAQPDLYVRGFLKLVPPRRRERGREVMEETGATLGQWLLAQLASMGIVGLLTTLGLWALGVPLALILGILAGLLEFIPNFGPLLAAVPAILLALVDSPQQALWVALLYGGIQTAESYLITPLVQQRLAALPPVLVIVSQILGGILFGVLGFAFATPLLAVAMVLVKRLYVEDRLGEPAP